MSGPDNKWLASVFREHPALLVSAMYLLASFVGMFYAWAFLSHFGINVFNYSQISDFLLASLKEPLTWGLVLLAGILVLMDNATSRRVGRKDTSRWIRWYGSPRYRFINNFAAILIVLIFIYAYALKQAENIREGQGKVVDVLLADESSTMGAVLLSTTGQFVFLLDRESNKVAIHPFENVQSITFQAD